MKIVESFLTWLPTVIAKVGDVRWTGGSDQFGQAFQARLTFGDVSSLDLIAPGRGALNISGNRAVWTPAGGAAALEQTLSTNSLVDDLRNGLTTDFSAVAQRVLGVTRDDLRSKLGWLGQASAEVTVLVIPGISVFGIKTAPLDLGSVVFPPLRGDLSLRNVAIDLAGGHVAFELRIHDAEAVDGGTLTVDLQGAKLAVDGPKLWMAADVLCSLNDKSARVAIDWLEFNSDELRASLPRSSGTPAATFAAKEIRVACRNILSYIDLGADRTDASSGDVSIAMSSIDLDAKNATLGPLQAQGVVLAGTGGAEAKLSIARSAFSGVVKFNTLLVTATQPTIVNLPVDGAPNVDLGAPISVEAHGLEIGFPAFELKGGIVDIDATLRNAHIRLAGLNIDVTEPFKIRGELSRNGADERNGAMLSVPHATMTSTSFPGTIELFEAEAKYWSEKPSAALNASKSILQARSIYALSILVKLPSFTLVPGQRVDIRPEDTDLFILFLRFLVAKLASISGAVQSALNIISDIVGRAQSILDKVGTILGFLVRIDDVRLTVGYKDVTVRIDPEQSGDNILTLRISTGMTGVGGKFNVSWPEPKFDDWFHRGGTEVSVFFPIDIDFPDLAVALQFTYDTAAKRIKIEAGDVYFAIGSGVAVTVEKYLQKIIMLYYGVGSYVDNVIQALNLRIPTGLPPQWDVTNLQIAKPSSDKVKGIAINLRANEVQFASL